MERFRPNIVVKVYLAWFSHTMAGLDIVYPGQWSL